MTCAGSGSIRGAPGAMRWRALLVTLGGVLMLASSGCAQLFVGGLVAAQALLPVSDAQEVAIGEAGAQQILAQPGVRVRPDPVLAAYVGQVGQRMARLTGRPALPWRFFVLEDPDRNAFALPGGFIFVTTGVLRVMSNEAQLAGVLGHEAAHVARRHGVAQLKRTMVAQGVLISTLGTSPQVAQLAGRLAAELALRGYGRQAELEADQLGARYAAGARYDPRQLISFLQVLGRSERRAPWLGPLETHPGTGERVARLEAEISREQLKGERLETQAFQQATAPLSSGGAGQ